VLDRHLAGDWRRLAKVVIERTRTGREEGGEK
jgi:hypothetical protein